MAIYMDTHDNTTDLPPALRKLVSERVRDGSKDEHGVVDKGIIIDQDGKKMHCILDAPDVNAVMSHHETLNVPLDHATIHRADVILR